MTVDVAEVRRAIYAHFVAEGVPPMPAQVASTLEVPSTEVEDAYRRLADDHVLVLAPGTPYIWWAAPLSALPTPFRVHCRDRDWYGVCIWDALGVIAMLGQEGSESGSVQTWCPDCDEVVILDVENGQVSVRDGEAVAHFAVPAASWWDDIGFT